MKGICFYQVRNDVTRYRYGDEQHLEEALKRIFQYGLVLSYFITEIKTHTHFSFYIRFNRTLSIIRAEEYQDVVHLS